MNNIEKIKPSGIFTNYIFKTIPLAFDESMSYYETLCGILSLLKTQEKVVNNNADLLAELESYVQNYFKNLDVQTEINNKLDEMATDGTLEELIAQYVNLSSVLAYNTLNDMKNATNLVNGSFVKTYGLNSLKNLLLFQFFSSFLLKIRIKLNILFLGLMQVLQFVLQCVILDHDLQYVVIFFVVPTFHYRPL